VFHNIFLFQSVKYYYEIERSIQLSYGKNPNYVDLFWLWDRVELGHKLRVVCENNPTNFDPENGSISFPSNFDIAVQTRPPKSRFTMIISKFKKNSLMRKFACVNFRLKKYYKRERL